MGVERNDVELVASRNNVALAASRNGALLLSPGGRPRPSLSVSPEYALSTVDLGAGSGATFRWNPGTGASSVEVNLPDGQITDLARRSHIVRSFDLEAGHYRDSTATIVSRNASGASVPVEATLVRYWPVVVTATLRALRPAPVGLLVFERYALDLTIQAKPWPGEMDITISPGREKGAPANHQLWRFFSVLASDGQQTRSLTGGHAPIIQRVRGANETVEYTITATSRRRDGRELSTGSATVTARWV